MGKEGDPSMPQAWWNDDVPGEEEPPVSRAASSQEVLPEERNVGAGLSGRVSECREEWIKGVQVLVYPGSPLYFDDGSVYVGRGNPALGGSRPSSFTAFFASRNLSANGLPRLSTGMLIGRALRVDNAADFD